MSYVNGTLYGLGYKSERTLVSRCLILRPFFASAEFMSMCYRGQEPHDMHISSCHCTWSLNIYGSISVIHCAVRRCTLIEATRLRRSGFEPATTTCKADHVWKNVGRAAQDDHEAVYPFDTHARVFRTAATEPSTGAGSTCSDTLAIAIVSADASYLVCSNTNSVSQRRMQPAQPHWQCWPAATLVAAFRHSIWQEAQFHLLRKEQTSAPLSVMSVQRTGLLSQ